MTSTFEIDVPSLKTRVTNILKSPKAEWPVIEAEPTTTEKLYKGYIAPLAAIPAVASFIGVTIIGVPVLFYGTVRTGVVPAFTNMVVSYLLTLGAVYLAALVINKLAPTFESRPDEMQALKLTAYSYTPAWVAGVLMVIPALSPIAAILGLYSIYLFYLGLPVLMKTPEAKVIPYMIVSAIVMIALMVAVGIVAAMLVGTTGIY